MRRLRFGTTLFVSAALLFCVEPMVAKLLMPLLGGAPAVWITCMLFFQAELLLGYAYAHAAIAWLGVRRQAFVHLAVLALPLLVLPIHVGPEEVARLTEVAHADNPVLPLLRVLTRVVGLPFFVVGATAPMVQRWFSASDEDDGKDPYFLYAASNVGSLLALAAYPVLIEPWIGLTLQTRIWRWGYALFAVLVASCAVTTLLVRGQVATRSRPLPSTLVLPITVARRARWVLYAFVPSSLLLAVTSYLTTDVAPIPLFWVVPLAIYLATFILVFARRPPVPHAWVVRALPFGLTATVMLLLVDASTPMILIAPLHLVTFFFASMVCHGELARDRPDSEHLTEFFLWVSVGGLLGGVANGLVAPVLFHGWTEYPIVLVVAAFCRRVPAESPVSRRDLVFGAVVLVVTFGLVALGNALHLDPAGTIFPLLFAAPLLVTYARLDRPASFALGLAAVLVGGASYDASVGKVLRVERGFFGVVRVTRDAKGTFTQVAHGNTIHGRQWNDPARRDEPTAYYTQAGPVGQMFDELHARHKEGESVSVGVVGLGAGVLATYARPAEAWTFYEINASMIALSEDASLFTFLRDAFPDPSRLHVVLGDARLKLLESPDASYDLLIIDAFSADAIPTHLLTREAIALYEAKLRPGGLLAIHISNRYLDLAPVLASLAADAGLAGFLRQDLGPGAEGWSPSIWTLLVRPESPPRMLANDARWKPFERAVRPPWSDDFSDLVHALHW